MNHPTTVFPTFQTEIEPQSSNGLLSQPVSSELHSLQHKYNISLYVLQRIVSQTIITGYYAFNYNAEMEASRNAVSAEGRHMYGYAVKTGETTDQHGP